MRTNLSNELCTQSFSNLSPRARYDEAGSHTLILDSSKRILDPLSEPSAPRRRGIKYLPPIHELLFQIVQPAPGCLYLQLIPRLIIDRPVIPGRTMNDGIVRRLEVWSRE